jgi:hypothetical protein
MATSCPVELKVKYINKNQLGSKNYELLKNKKGIRQVFHYYNRTAPGMD